MIHTFIGTANEWKFKNSIKSEIKKVQPGTKFLVMFGIHGSRQGYLLNTDEKLRLSFNAAIDAVKRTEHEILEEKGIIIEPLEIETQEMPCGKMELVNKMTIVEKCKDCNHLILCFCFTKVNEANSFFRSTGLYTELFMNQELSDMHGRYSNNIFANLAIFLSLCHWHLSFVCNRGTALAGSVRGS